MRHLDQRHARPARLAGRATRRRRACAGLPGSDRSKRCGSRSARVEDGAVGVLAPAPGQPAAGQRAPRDDAHAVARHRSAARRPRCRGRASSTAAARRRSAAGAGRAATHCASHDRRRREGRRADDSAPCRLTNEIGERAERLLDVDVRARSGGSGRGRSSRCSAVAASPRPRG